MPDIWGNPSPYYYQVWNVAYDHGTDRCYCWCVGAHPNAEARRIFHGLYEPPDYCQSFFVTCRGPAIVQHHAEGARDCLTPERARSALEWALRLPRGRQALSSLIRWGLNGGPLSCSILWEPNRVVRKEGAYRVRRTYRGGSRPRAAAERTEGGTA